MTAELAEELHGQAIAPPAYARPSKARRVLVLAIRYLLHPPIPLRWRLALLYAAVLGFTLAVADLTAYISLSRYLAGEMDENLRSQAREISGTIDLRREASQTQSRVNVFIRFPNLDAFAAPGMTVQVLNLDGKMILQSENLRDRNVPVDAEHVELALRGTSSFDTVPVDDIP